MRRLVSAQSGLRPGLRPRTRRRPKQFLVLWVKSWDVAIGFAAALPHLFF
jgi:hypothetical protein